MILAGEASQAHRGRASVRGYDGLNPQDARLTSAPIVGGSAQNMSQQCLSR